MIKKKNVVKVALFLFLFSVISGFIYYYIKKPSLLDLVNNIISNPNSINKNVLSHNLLLVIFIFILALSIIGLIFMYMVFFIESFSIGFTLALFFHYYKIKGLLFYLVYFLIFKFPFIIIFTYYLLVCSMFSIKFLNGIISDNNIIITKYIKNHFIRFVMVFIFTLVYSLIIKYFSLKILSIIVYYIT